MTGLDPRTIAADIICQNGRDITISEIWAHISQAYDTAEIDAAIADGVYDLIGKTGIDLIWPDGTKNTELDAARVEIERLRAELTRAVDQRDAYQAMANEIRAQVERQASGVVDGLTDEPGPEITEVRCADGEIWVRSPGGWKLTVNDRLTWELTWEQIASMGPVTRVEVAR